MRHPDWSWTFRIDCWIEVSEVAAKAEARAAQSACRGPMVVEVVLVDVLVVDVGVDVLEEVEVVGAVDVVTGTVHSKLAGHLFIANSTPNFASMRLDALSGKVVCVLHPDYAPSMIDPATGTFPYADYGVEGKGGGFIQHSSNANFGVFDSYTNANDVDEMVPDQQSKRTLYRGYGNDYLFLLSWTLTGCGSIFNLDLLSSTANGQLPQGPYDPNHPQIPNIIYIDNVDGWLCRAILSLNPGI